MKKEKKKMSEEQRELHRKLEEKLLGMLSGPEASAKEDKLKSPGPDVQQKTKPEKAQKKTEAKPDSAESESAAQPEKAQSASNAVEEAQPESAESDSAQSEPAAQQKTEEPKPEAQPESAESALDKKPEAQPEQASPKTSSADANPPAEAPSEKTKNAETPASSDAAPGKPPETQEKKKPEKMPKKSLSELVSERDEIEALLSSIEDSYRDATLPDSTYREVKEKNEKKLKEINNQIEKLEKATGEKAPPVEAEKPPPTEKAPAAAQPSSSVPVHETTAAPAPAGHEKAAGVTESDTSRADAIIKLLEEKIESKLRNVIDTANVEITDKRVKKLERRLEILENALRDTKAVADSSSQSVGNYDKQFTMMKTEIERMKALMDSVKESKNIIDEKFQRLSETFAEVRSVVYQREAKSKEEEMLLDKLKDTVSQVDTARIMKEFTTRDEQMRDINTRLERLERSSKMLNENMNRIKGLMTDIGSLENIMKGSKHVGEKLEKIQEIEERMKARSSKLDSIYVDIKRKLDEFAEYKVKQDQLTSLTEDTMKNIEELTRRMADYASKTDIENIKEQLNVVKEMASKASVSPAPAAATSPLQDEKEEIETLLATLEENHKNNEISDEEYQKAKEANMMKLAEIEKKMKSAESSGGSGRKEHADEKHARVMMLAKLRESYENGEISKRAYERSKELLLKKK
ncbi:MAG: hypothetical protein J7K54_04565 [Candidatus Aenigmarchaeota archaeon]|nr:hypothetical protein [Candidatus Aenigmarchaeota archaeon]